MRFSQDVESQRLLLRSLMNVRYPGKSLNPEYLCLQDELLAEEREEKGVVNVMELPIRTVWEYLKGSEIQKVVFNVFQDHDKKLYDNLLQ